MSEPNSQLMIWRMCFSEFDIDVRDKKSFRYNQAVALSRLRSLIQKFTLIETEIPSYPLYLDITEMARTTLFQI